MNSMDFGQGCLIPVHRHGARSASSSPAPLLGHPGSSLSLGQPVPLGPGVSLARTSIPCTLVSNPHTYQQRQPTSQHLAQRCPRHLSHIHDHQHQQLVWCSNQTYLPHYLLPPGISGARAQSMLQTTDPLWQVTQAPPPIPPRTHKISASSPGPDLASGQLATLTAQCLVTSPPTDRSAIDNATASVCPHSVSLSSASSSSSSSLTSHSGATFEPSGQHQRQHRSYLHPHPLQPRHTLQSQQQHLCSLSPVSAPYSFHLCHPASQFTSEQTQITDSQEAIRSSGPDCQNDPAPDLNTDQNQKQPSSIARSVSGQHQLLQSVLPGGSNQATEVFHVAGPNDTKEKEPSIESLVPDAISTCPQLSFSFHSDQSDHIIPETPSPLSESGLLKPLGLIAAQFIPSQFTNIPVNAITIATTMSSALTSATLTSDDLIVPSDEHFSGAATHLQTQCGIAPHLEASVSADLVTRQHSPPSRPLCFHSRQQQQLAYNHPCEECPSFQHQPFIHNSVNHSHQNRQQQQQLPQHRHHRPQPQPICSTSSANSAPLSPSDPANSEAFCSVLHTFD
ncbi:unnamed protein product [Protopolystoma xenopodis]|uniref:Uncharacterized protein n=1 Tax=Protopolystoma xenopodis TaxID=117903 RepID=A0A3S5A331_9PLAT|nr:unnamed protein product [Protopolystoma xenopodis]